MMIRVNDEFLDFDEDIENVRQSKLFEAMQDTVGDFSYSFEIPITSKNLKILTFPFADVSSKKIYRILDCDILDNDGLILHKGSLRVEKSNKVINCSFFSGNNNWIGQLSGKISSLDFSRYDSQINKTNVQNSWSLTEGVKFPFMDTGNLLTRSHGHTIIEDWSPCIFVKTIFETIFTSHSIKIQGELIDDPIYQKLLISTNIKDQNEIDNNTAIIGKTVPQTLDNTVEIISFDDDTTYPFKNTINNDFDLSTERYISPITSKFKVEFSFIVQSNYNGTYPIFIRKNGVPVSTHTVSTRNGVSITQIGFDYVSVIPGDYIDFTTNQGAVSNAIFMSGSVKITPFFNYDFKGSALVPKWTQQDFVRSVISLFNVVSDYDPYSKTITFNFFDRVKSKDSIDISKYVTVTDTDFVEFVSNYGKNNYFSYKQTNEDDLKKYNVKNFLNYVKGNITIDNDYIQQSVDVIKSDFSSPVSYINRQFGSPSIERLNLLQLTDSDSVDITSITDDSGVSKFNVSLDIIQAGDLIRIETDSKNLSLDGEWVVSSVGSGFFKVDDIPFIVTDTGKVTILITSTASNDDVFLLLDTGLQAYSDMSTNTYLWIDNTQYILIASAFFNLLNTGLPITNNFKQGLSFGSIINPLSFQKNLLETFWNSFRLIMNDPTKIFVDGYLPKKVYIDLTPLKPVFIKTEQTSNEYYVNKITGYKNSYTPCIMELIKL